MRDLLLGLREALRGDLLHHLHRHVREVGEEHRAVHACGAGGLCGGSARVAARLCGQHVGLRHARVLARARNACVSLQPECVSLQPVGVCSQWV